MVVCDTMKVIKVFEYYFVILLVLCFFRSTVIINVIVMGKSNSNSLGSNSNSNRLSECFE